MLTVGKIPCIITSLSNPPMPSSSNIASSNTFRFFFSGTSAARTVLISSSFDSRSGLTALGRGAAPDVVDRSEDGTISNVNQCAVEDILSVAIMKSRAMTLIVFGSTTSLSVLEYICGYRRCTAFSAASVHKAYISNAIESIHTLRSAPPYPFVCSANCILNSSSKGGSHFLV